MSMSLPLKGLLGLSALLVGVHANAADPLAYALLLNATGSQSEIGTLDLATGTLSNVVQTTFGGGDEAVNGLAYLPGTSTYYTNVGSSLYSVDVSTGALKKIGSTGIPSGPGIFTAPVTTRSAAYEVLAKLGSAVPLYSLNTTSAATAVIGNTGIVPVNNSTASSGLTGLYVINDEGASDTGHLYSIDPHTGGATLIGDTGVKGFRGLIDAGGVDYSVSDPGDSFTQQQIYSVDLDTGKSKLLRNIANKQAGYFFVGLAPITSAVPEPGTPALFTLGVLATLAAGLRRRT